MPYIPPTGAFASPYDIRTFSYPTKAYDKVAGGKRYDAADIEDQSKVGICTAIHLTQNARKATGIKFSADFQYLLQKKFHDANLPIGWQEGSSIFAAVKIGQTYGFLPAEHWTFTTQADRDGSYENYIAKLKAVPEAEVTRLLKIASKYKLKAYASVPVDRDSMAKAIDESKAGILVRFNVGREWWTDAQGNVTWDAKHIQPLRKPKTIVSGHAIIESNYDGGSFRVANTWGPEWADKGTAYHLLKDYAPTEAWSVWYWDTEIPKEIEDQKENRKKIIGQIMDLLQQVLKLLPGLA